MITVTSKAAEFIKEQLTKRGTPESALRVGIRGGMCAGYAYSLEFCDDPPRSNDTIVEQDGVRIFIDPKSLIFLSGSELDFEQTMIHRGLKLRNPHEKTRCGCGESFGV